MPVTSVAKLARNIGALGAFVAISFGGASARAEGGMTVEQCVAANEGGDAMRKASKLIDARKELRACAAASCPRVVRDDCAAQLDVVEKAIPTIVFAAKGPNEIDLVAVRVLVDGVSVAERLDGSAIEIDPGEHTFELTTEGYPTYTKKLVIREGAKGRQEVVRFGADATTPDMKRGRLVVSTESDAVIAIDGKSSASGHLDAPLAAGPHELRVTKPGKLVYKASIDLRAGETRQMDVALEDAPRRSLVPWIIGGAVVVAAAAIGGYFLFKPEDETAAPPTGRLGSVTLGSWGR